jgi:hypothetical protein
VISIATRKRTCRLRSAVAANQADIDQAKIVWARSMDAARNYQLLAYFKGRRIWSLEVDDDEALQKPKPYPAIQCP